MSRYSCVLGALRPKMGTSKDNRQRCIDLTGLEVKCTYCNEKVKTKGVFCAWCTSCLYCSDDCESKDRTNHSIDMCIKLFELAMNAGEQADALRNTEIDPSLLFVEGLPAIPHTRHEEAGKALRDYFTAREKLNNELLREGGRGRNSRAGNIGNELAIEVALANYRDLVLLRKTAHDGILNLYLATDRIQDMYDMSCFFARRGNPNLVTYSDEELKSVWKKDVPRRDVKNLTSNANKEMTRSA